MTRVLTLTMNPAIDVATSVDAVVDERKLRCQPPRQDPGGGGVNVARVIHRLGGDTDALLLCGGPTGETLVELLRAEGIDCRPVAIRGATRMNVSVYEESTHHRYRFVMPGPELEEGEWRRALAELETLAEGAGYVVASGSLPPGVPEDFYARVAEVAKRRGARLVLDTSGVPLRAALGSGVFLVKPNRAEAEALAGRPLADAAALEAFAGELVGRGAAETVVISLSQDGALAVARDARVRVPAPAVKPISTVGAGDSFVAGVTLGLARDLSLLDACRLGAAAAAATLISSGTELARREDAERFLAELRSG